MAIEIDNSEQFEDLQRFIETHSSRLPKSVRKYVRQLKSQGLKEEAAIVREQTINRKTENIAKKLLDETVDKILQEKDANTYYLLAIKALWLMNAAGIIDSEERKKQVAEIYQKPDIDDSFMEAHWPTIAETIAPLMPKERNKY